MKHMKSIAIVFSIALLVSCNKQEEFNQATLEGLASLPENAIKEPYENNPDLIRVTLEAATGNSQGDYLNGQRTGTWTEYSQTGMPKTITTYVDGIQQGAYFEIDDRGQLQKVAYYGNGQLNGDWKQFNHTRIKEERHYANGKIDGMVKIYYDNGKILEEGQYAKGLRNGISKWYDQEGNVTIEYEYNNGELVNK